MGLFNKGEKKLRKPEPNVPVGAMFKERKTLGVELVDYGKYKGLAIHKVADIDPVTDEKTLAGVRLYGPPVQVCLPRSVVERGIREKWVTATEPEIKYLHLGPEDDPTRHIDAVTHYKYLTFNTLDGDITYEITQNPGREDRAYYGRAI